MSRKIFSFSIAHLPWRALQQAREMESSPCARSTYPQGHRCVACGLQNAQSRAFGRRGVSKSLSRKDSRKSTPVKPRSYATRLDGLLRALVSTFPRRLHQAAKLAPMGDGRILGDALRHCAPGIIGHGEKSGGPGAHDIVAHVVTREPCLLRGESPFCAAPPRRSGRRAF